MDSLVLLVKETVIVMLNFSLISLFVYIILGYFPNSRETRIYDFLYNFWEPILSKLRFLSIGPISFAALAVFIIIELLIELLKSLPL